jgi:lysine-N-methylase
MSTLHPTKTVQSVQPKYVSSFSCTGPACEDNCCTGWTVHVDKKTFNAYRQAKTPELTERLESKVKRVRSLNSDTQYARIEMKPVTQECPFMEEKLCGIQKTLGEDKLSDTCATYPRNNRLLGGQHEQSLTLSCPEAARLALLQADAMDFVEGSMRVRPEVISSSKPKHGLSSELVSSVRVFALQLMRTEGLELWQKLAVLGFFCEQLTQYIKTARQAEIPSLLGEVGSMVTSGAIVDALIELKPDYAIQATVFSSLWQLKINRKHSPVQEAVQKAVAQGLGADPETHEVANDKLIAHYTSGVIRLPLAMKEVPFLLQNYLINEMFNEVFPFGEAKPDQHFLKLVTRFGLVRLMLSAQCSDSASMPTSEQMARTVQVFCRQYQHDVKFAKSVNTALENTGWDSLEKIYRFLRT